MEHMPSLSHLVSEATIYIISDMSHDHHPPLLLDPLQESKEGTVDALPEGKFDFEVVKTSAGVEITFTYLDDPDRTFTISKIS